MQKEKEVASRNWFRLDNSASVYPMVITTKTQSLYRVATEFTDVVDADDLAAAAEKAFLRFPYFKVELRSGLFRNSLLSNYRKIHVSPDDGILLKRINFRRNGGYIIRISYYKKKMFLDFFHGLCDGMGALEFVKTLIFYYLKERGVDVESEGKVRVVGDEISPEEIGDGFKTYYEKFNLKQGIAAMAGKDAYMVKGEHFKKEGFGNVLGYVSGLALRDLARSYGVTVTVLISALAMLSVAKAQNVDTQDKDFLAFVPINLRTIFPLDTMFNYTTMLKCRIPASAERTIENYCQIVKDELNKQLDKASLKLKVSFTSLMDKNVFFRFLPLFVKSFIARFGRMCSRTTKQTMIVSNLGRVDLPSGCKNHVEDMYINLNCSKKTPNNLSITSFGDVTVLSFTRQIVATDIEKEFFTFLQNNGVNVRISSNLREVSGAKM